MFFLVMLVERQGLVVVLALVVKSRYLARLMRLTKTVPKMKKSRARLKIKL